MIKLTIIRTDKSNTKTVVLKTMERLIERIANDDSRAKVTRFRQNAPFLNGNYECYVDMPQWQHIRPAAAYVKDANGNVVFQSFNGLLLLTLGGIRSEERADSAKRAVAQLPMTFAALRSADGMALNVLVSIARADGTLPVGEMECEELYRAAYSAALPLYSSVVGAAAQKEEPRLASDFLMTMDGRPYYNKRAVPMRVTGEHAAASADMKDVTDLKLYDDYDFTYRRAAEEVDAAMAASAVEWESSEERRQALYAALAVRLRGLGFPEEEAFTHIMRHNWSAVTQEQVRQIVGTAYSDGAAPQPAPDGSTGKTRDGIHRMISFLKNRYVFRYNTVMKCTEYRPNSTWVNAFQTVTPRVQKRMTLEVELADINATIKDVRNFLESDIVRNYDPVEEYLYDCMGHWDGNDHIGALARTVPNRNPHWEEWFRTWFLAMVNQWRRLPRRLYGNSVAPLLISPQGYNKSTFCRSLIPDELAWGYNDNLLLSEKRQVLQAMSQFLLINLDEFNQISPAVQQGFLKNLIQLPSVKVKRPYGSHVEEFPRLASFIATSNLNDILADPSGNRRFIGVELTAPIDVSVRPNHRQLFAQAMTALEHGEKAYFDERQTSLIMEHNLQFRVALPIEQYFDEYFEPAKDTHEGQYMTPAAIFSHLRRIVGPEIQRYSLILFGRMLANRRDIIHKKTNKGTGYLVVMRK